jgi:2,5-dihydroxypyridine 5,6-dioxygenase
MSSQQINPTLLQENANTLVHFCGGVKKGEKVLLIFDTTTQSIEPYLRVAADSATDKVTVVHMDASAMHGVEPPANVAAAMEVADVILGLTRSSLAHTEARFNATNRGARYLSLPQYGIDQLSRSSLAIDFIAAAEPGKRLKSMLDNAQHIVITTPLGTHLELSAKGRIANWAPGYCHEPGMLSSPPDIETNVAPVEHKSNGVVVVDGSIPCEVLGLLKENVRVTVKGGYITDISTNHEGVLLNTLMDAKPDKNRRVLAEFGIGLNPKAELCGLMLEDEGALGTIHFGFGSNITIGGRNKTDFHLDMIVRNPTVEIDGVRIMKDGSLVLP